MDGAAAHRAGVVHRDLKPGNIKITPDGRVKVLDFGLATSAPGERTEREMTHADCGRVVGTPAYMSPEQAQGKDIGRRTDIWSFGCILYEMLTGQLPFEGETAGDVLAHIVEHEPDWNRLPQQLPKNIRSLLRRCLEKEADRRPEDIATVVAEIGVARRQSAASEIGARPTARKRMLMVAAVALLLILFGLARDSIPERPSRHQPGLMVSPFEQRGTAGLKDEEVTSGSGTKRFEPQWQALASSLTSNEKAQGYYVRGNAYFYRSYVESNLRTAIRMYQQAIESDGQFALAYAWLARAHAYMYWFLYDRTEARLAMAGAAIERAQQLDPDLPEVHLALGHYYYHCHLDYNRALEEFAIFRKARPDTAEVLGLIGYVLRHQGQCERALECLQDAYRLDQLSNILAAEIANTSVVLGDYAKAAQYYDRAIWLAPDESLPYWRKALLCLLWEGRTENARTVIQDALLANAASEQESRLLHLLVTCDIYDRRYPEALTRLSACGLTSFDSHFHFVPKVLLTAQINERMGDEALAQDNYEAARRLLRAQVEAQPEDGRVRGSLGMAYAGLGRTEDAVREGKLGYAMDLARIYAMVDKPEEATDLLEVLLARPAVLSVPLLRLDPTWDPLREHPRFKALVESDE